MNKQVCNAIDRKFRELRQNGDKALIAYIAAGDPDLATTEQLILEMEKAGADLIEIGIPFSDPVAEGPIIAAASERALKNGDVCLKNVFAMVKRLRDKCRIPLLLMLYANSVFAHGIDRFFADCADSGISGAIVPDVPFEERMELQPIAHAHNVHLINLVAPTSGERIDTIAADSQGFLYCVSSTGVTGVRSEFSTDFDSLFRRIRAASDVPAALGFGISTPEQIRQLAPYCDGLIVGSAIVRIIGRHGRDCLQPVSEFVTALKNACLSL